MEQNLSRINRVKALLYRKLIHILFSVGLIIPLFMGFNDADTQLYYTVLLFGASILYIYQVKRPLISVVIRNALDEARRNVKASMVKVAEAINAPNVKELISSIDKFEYAFNEFVRSIERDYERKWGYLGVLMGMVGIYISYIAVNTYVYYGALALIFYDTSSALFGTVIGRTRMPYSGTTVEGVLMGSLIFSLVLGALVGVSYVPILYMIGIALGIAESYSGEDNLTIPIVASLLAYLLKLPRI